MRRLDADELAKLIYLDQNAWIDLVKIEEKTEIILLKQAIRSLEEIEKTLKTAHRF